jgi:ribosomal protein S18 acetylase RimI-like enzyme
MRPRIAYRIGERGDIETVKELFRTEGELSSVAIGVLAHDDLVFWLALDGDELVGVVLTRPLPSETRPRYGGVDELLVARTHRRLGVGRHLMELSEAHYREEGLDGLQLVVVEHNEPALNLYRAIGFDVVQTRLRMMKPF